MSTQLLLVTYRKILMFLAGCGSVVSSYLIVQHYKLAGTSFCVINNFVSCDIVNQSMYAEIAGIPVAILGFITYIVLFVLAMRATSKKDAGLLALISAGSLAFSLYLTYLELFVLNAVCILCITSQIIILLYFIISLLLWRKNPHS